MNLMIDEGKEFSLQDSFSRIEKSIIRQAMKKHDDCQAKAAHLLGKTDRQIRRLMKMDIFLI